MLNGKYMCDVMFSHEFSDWWYYTIKYIFYYFEYGGTQ